MLRSAILGLSVLALSACSSVDEAEFVPVAADDLVRNLDQGRFAGFESEHGAAVWMALPYAAPPIGNLRWRAPRPPVPHHGVQDALNAGPVCLQVTNNLSAGERYDPGVLIGDENCLTLDVYAPRDAAAGDDLPVMMWIHGGSNTWGSSSAYDGSTLASQQGVIVVAVQYRLGPIGFLSHPAVRDGSEMPDDEAANFALLDLVAALDWIQTNITAFGGDTSRVTVFGESAGAYNISGLMTMPQARGLFHRAIMQSGGTASVARDIAENGGGQDDVPANRAVMAMAGAEASGEMLRLLSPEAVFAPYRDEDGELLTMPRMIEDGVTLPLGGIRAAAASPDGFARVPLLTGTNRDEMKLYTVFNDRLTRRLGPLVWPRDGDAYNAAVEYPSRVWRYNAVDELLSSLAANGHTDLWSYRFDWDEGGSVLLTDTGDLLGAAHAMEIPFVFNHFELFGSFDSVLFNARNAEGRIMLAEAMGAYWGAFAATGIPGDADGLGPEWPRWSEAGDALRLDTVADGGIELITRRESPGDIAADLARDDRLDDTLRCAVAADISSRETRLRPDFDRAINC